MSKIMSDQEVIAGARTGVDEPGTVALTPLTGRDTEVSLLKDRWEQAQEGMGQVVLLVGEPGLGKSRLVHTIKQIVVEEMRDEVPAAGADFTPEAQTPCIVEWQCPQGQGPRLPVRPAVPRRRRPSVPSAPACPDPR